MSPRWTRTLAGLLLILALAAIMLPAASGQAQDATPTPAQAEVTPTEPPGTPTPTSTPTLTPTATATLTDLEARLLLAQTYLTGQDYDQAALLFGAIAEEERGNVAALTGLQAALEGRAQLMATMIAPPPTVAPAPLSTVAPAPKPTLGDAVSSQLREFFGTALAALLLIVAVYLLANVLRWLLQALREVWYLRVLPLLRRPAVAPGYIIGEFTNGLATPAGNAVRIVPLVMTEKLLAWNQLVQAKEVPVEPEPSFSLGGMSWLKILWRWILPPPRGYKVTGALLLSDGGLYQLVVQRIGLARNNIDRGATFEKAGASPDAAFRDLAGEAAKWLVTPGDIEGGEVVMRGMRAVRGAGDASFLTASEVFDQALELLLPIRKQVNAGAVDFADARNRLRSAEALLGQLPGGSSLRQDLQAVIADLRRSVPAG